MGAAGRGKDAKVLPLAAAPASARLDGPRVGQVVSAARGTVKVDFPGNGRGPLRARVAAGIADEDLARAAEDRQEAVLLFEDGDAARPIVVALLRSATPLVDAALRLAAPDARRVARVDGERVVLEGKEEVVLRCGEATLTLRRDGRIVLRGVDIVTQAARVQKIRGGKVQIN